MEKLNSFNETASEIGQLGASVYTAPWSLVSTQAVCILSNDSPPSLSLQPYVASSFKGSMAPIGATSQKQARDSLHLSSNTSPGKCSKRPPLLRSRLRIPSFTSHSSLGLSPQVSTWLSQKDPSSCTRGPLCSTLNSPLLPTLARATGRVRH